MDKIGWFYLNPDTFIWKNKQEALVFNSESGKGFITPLGEVSLNLVDRLLDPLEMYCVELNMSEGSDNMTIEFIKKIVSTESGGVIEKSNEKVKPIVLFPKLNIQRSVERQNEIIDIFRDDKIVLDLFEISIYFNGINDLSKTAWHKQFPYPPVTKDVLDSKNLLKHLSSLSTSTGLRSINLIASDFSKVISFPEIADALCRINSSKTLWCRLDDLKNGMRDEVNRMICGGFKGKIVVDPISDCHRVKGLIDNLVEKNHELDWEFIITSNSDYELAVEVSENINRQVEVSVVPLFTGENFDFFKEHVFIRPEKLLNSGLKKREVFAHQAVNTFDFGKVSIMPDGLIYANRNHPPIGNTDEILKDVLHRELFSGQSWRRIRDTRPCTDCLYQWLCPSPSNYELVIGRPDLCLKEV